MPRLKLTLAYVGTRFSGWQTQERPNGPHPSTVQAEVEQALRTMLGRHAKTPLRVHGAGRTDAGVHAAGQVAHVDIPDAAWADVNCTTLWVRRFSALLPHDVAVTAVEPVTPEFHARTSAKGKRYTYSLWLRREYVLPQLRDYVWACGPVDIEPMRQAIPYLLGAHDFASMQNSGSDIKTTTRTITAIDVAALSPDRMAWHFEADGFLKQMVRNLTGLLVATGQGVLAPADIPAILAARDRRALPTPTAPARGLSLTEVFY